MKHTTIIFLLTLFMLNATSQNLILNGSFEKFYRCPNNFSEKRIKKFLPNWEMPTKGNPDYFNKCSKDMVGVPQNFMGNIHAFEGVGYVGFVLLDTPKNQKKEINYREYLQTRLGTTLQYNELYLVKFYYSVAAYSTYGINRLGIYFSHNKIEQKKGVLNYKPQVYIDTSAIYFNPGEWIQFCDTFRASGTENYITIGNFYPDSKTSFINNDISMYAQNIQHKINTNQIAYYYIDNISIEKIKREDFKTEYDFIQKFKPFSHYNSNELLKPATLETAYILDEVYYDTTKSNLSPVSLFQVNNLVKILTNNPQITVKLIGLLAENENDVKYSQQRTQQLLHILTSKGIASSRVSTSIKNIKVVPRSQRLYQSGKPVSISANLVALMFNAN